MSAAILWGGIALLAVLISLASKVGGRPLSVGRVFKALGGTFFGVASVAWTVAIFNLYSGIPRVLLLIPAGALALVFVAVAVALWLDLLGIVDLLDD